MENKTYTYRDVIYRLKPITLGVLSSAAPMLAKFRKLQQKYTCDIDMKPVDAMKERIAEIELSIDQLKETEDTNPVRLAELEEKLEDAKKELDNDIKIQSAVTLYNECIGLAMLELIGDRNLVTSFVNSVLETVGGNCMNIDIDFNGNEALDFIRDVVHDFFYSIAGARKITAG